MSADYALADEALLALCQRRRSAGSGPGGQHANKTATAVTLTHNASGIVAQSSVHRDGRRNQQVALARLRLRLALAQRGGGDPMWLQPFRAAAGRLKVSAHNPQFHLVIGYCIDVLAEHDYQISAAAVALACSSSQLIKVFAVDKEVWAWLQTTLQQHGHPSLRHP